MEPAKTTLHGNSSAFVQCALVLLGTMADADPALYRHSRASWYFTSLSYRPMRTTHSCFLHAFITARKFALLALGTVRDADTALHDAIRAAPDSTHTAHSLPSSALPNTLGLVLDGSFNPWLGSLCVRKRNSGNRRLNCFVSTLVRCLYISEDEIILT